jgi:DNA-directed RNA polymerase specialized sigma24 family protein
MINPNDPDLEKQLSRRTELGRYVISEIELIKSLRELRAAGNIAGARILAGFLVQRCAPAFQRFSQGLRHRPDLREEAIANMAEHLLREAQDPKEIFIVQNFVHYLRCLCVDEFNRVLRQEGLIYRRDAAGRPAGRPQHVPRALVESLRPPADDESAPASDVADPGDQYETLHATYESQRILNYLTDPLDRTIVVLRSLEEMKWDDIAKVCNRTERTVRLRYERARSYLSQCLLQERQVAFAPSMQPQ